MLRAIRAVTTFTAPPDSVGSARAFSRIGYTLPEALADLVDNSIDAGASRVEITFWRNDDFITAVTIADDGCGMAEEKLKSAMQFASSATHKSSDLGTFGLGMKAASLSQCQSMTVISRKNGKVSACRWTSEAIKSNWSCEVLDPKAAAAAFTNGFPRESRRDSGTLVMWDNLDRLATGMGAGDLDAFLSKTISSLQTELGLTFHRFLTAPSFNIILQTRHEVRLLTFPRSVEPLNPFPAVTGRRGYPKNFHATLPGGGRIMLKAHIWPAEEVSPGFLLGRRTATPRQGFYFFRNDRLIQAGGWNDFIAANERELTLARVAVDLPSGGTTTNVQKSAIQVSAALAQALDQARSGTTSLTDYLEDARKAFRAGKHRQRPSLKATVALGAGFGAPLRKSIKRLIANSGVVREIDFSWGSLAEGQFFERVEDRIVLNKKYRKQILSGSPASSADAVMVKTLMFLLLQDDFDRARSSDKRTEWIAQCNAILLAAVKTI